MKRGSMQEQVLRASKEIAVKFIETGRLSPTSFAETFKNIYEAIDTTVKGVPDRDTVKEITAEEVK